MTAGSVQSRDIVQTASAGGDYAAAPEGSHALPSTERAWRTDATTLAHTEIHPSGSTLALARSGAVYLAPALASPHLGIARSCDQGVSWDVLLPAARDVEPPTWTRPHLYVDRGTDRVFLLTPARATSGTTEPGQHSLDLRISADGGTTWEHAAVTDGAHAWGPLCAGPAASSGPHTYPHTLYVIGSTRGDRADSHTVYRSRDGGLSFEPTAALTLDAAALGDAGDPAPSRVEGCVVLPEGSLVVAARIGARLGIAVSRDEGESFSVTPVAGASLADPWPMLRARSRASLDAAPREMLACDATGCTYIVWVGRDRRAQMSISWDGARTFSTPLVVSAPDVREVRGVSVAARDAGHVVVAYSGSRDGRTFHGYVAESRRALAPQPRFHRVPVKALGSPLFTADAGEHDLGRAILDPRARVQVRCGANGEIWVHFVKDAIEGSLARDGGAATPHRLLGVAACIPPER